MTGVTYEKLKKGKKFSHSNLLYYILDTNTSTHMNTGLKRHLECEF